MIAQSKMQGHLAVLSANVIFGLSVPVTNDLVNSHFTPGGYMFFRCLGAAVIFWALACFTPREKVPLKDLMIIIAGGVVGIAVSQSFAAWSLRFTQPVYFSLIATLTPIATMLLAAMFIGEKINGIKTAGVVIGIAGAMLMVIMGWQAGTGKNDLLGIFLALMSLLTWAIYLIITRKVSAKYSAITQMKWIFLASAIVTFPLSQGEFFAQDCIWQQALVEMSFVVVFATVLGFFCIPYAMARIQATTVSVYTNLQPVVASVVAFTIGQDVLTWDKPVAAVLVLLSAYMVGKGN